MEQNGPDQSESYTNQLRLINQKKQSPIPRRLLRSIHRHILPRLILHRNIVRPPNCQRGRLLPKLISRKNTLLALFALEVGNFDIIFPGSGPFTPVERRRVEVATAVLVASAVAIAV